MYLPVIILGAVLGTISAAIFCSIVSYIFEKVYWKFWGAKIQKEIDDNPKYIIKHITSI